jgi:hypothetical protein
LTSTLAPARTAPPSSRPESGGHQAADRDALAGDVRALGHRQADDAEHDADDAEDHGRRGQDGRERAEQGSEPEDQREGRGGARLGVRQDRVPAAGTDGRDVVLDGRAGHPAGDVVAGRRAGLVDALGAGHGGAGDGPVGSCP